MIVICSRKQFNDIYKCILINIDRREEGEEGEVVVVLYSNTLF